MEYILSDIEYLVGTIFLIIITAILITIYVHKLRTEFMELSKKVIWFVSILIFTIITISAMYDIYQIILWYCQ